MLGRGGGKIPFHFKFGHNLATCALYAIPERIPTNHSFK